MLNETKSPWSIRPAAGDHAITQAGFGFQWDEPLSAALIALLIAHHEPLKDKLPRRQEIQQAIVVQHDDHEEPASEPVLAALIMDKLDENGRPEKQLVVQPTMLNYNDFKHYKGWTEYRREAMEVVSPFLDLIRQKHPITVAGLQYVDAFDLDNPAQVAADVFQHGKLLPEHVFSREDIWHVHQGYFITTDEPLPHKRLTNVDIGVVRKEIGARLDIKCLHRAFFDPNEMPYEHDRLGELQNCLHEENKRVLEDILKTEVQEMIGLRKRGG